MIKEFATREEYIIAAKNLAETHENLCWFSEKPTILKGYEGEGLYERIPACIKLIFNAATDIGFEFEGVEYNLIPPQSQFGKNILVCWQCADQSDLVTNAKEAQGLYECPACDRSFENGEFI
jgi:hypothetical protein